MATQLVHQLSSLGYTEGFDTSSLPLVERLVADLCTAADAYRALEASALEAAEQKEQAGYQLEVLKREVGRLTGESSQLRQDLLREADARAALEKDHYQTGRQLEAQLAAAYFAREQVIQRLTVVEQENEGLRSKAASLLSVGQQCALECKPSPAAQAKTSRGAISLIKAADQRILALESDLKRREAQLQGLEAQLTKAQAGFSNFGSEDEDLKTRDLEVAQLTPQLSRGPDVDKLAWQYRNEANEAVILQLNQQVEALTFELTALQQRAVDKAVLKAAEQACQEAESRAQALEDERGSVAAEVEDMQKALTRLQQEASSENQARLRLGKLKANLEESRAQKAQLEGQLTHAETKGAARKLQQRCKQLEAELKQRQALNTTASAAACEGNTSAVGNEEMACRRCQTLQSQLEEAERQHAELVIASKAVKKERELLQDHLQHATDQLAEAQQQLAEAAAVAALGGSTCMVTEVTSSEDIKPGSAVAEPVRQSSAALADEQLEQAQQLQQQVATLLAQVEQLEFERAELRVKLEKSENQVASLAALAHKPNPAAEQQPLSIDKQGELGSDDGSSRGSEWHLAARRPSSTSVSETELGLIKQALAQAREQEESMRQQVLQLREQVAGSEGRNASLQADLASVQATAGDAATAAVAVGDLRRQLDDRSREVADLTAISIKAGGVAGEADATIQQYMVQLKHLSTELRASELRLEDAETEMRRRGGLEQGREAELAELRGVVGALDAARDTLQAELDRKAEAAVVQAEAMAGGQQQLEESQRCECMDLKNICWETVGVLTQHLGALEAEYDALRDEFQAVTDDLEAMVVSNQLCTVTQERDDLAEQARLHSTRNAYHEQLVRAREGDLQEIRTAYEGLAHENQRLQSTVTQLQRELAARDSELAIRADEIASLREAQRSAQSQINQYIADLQAYERQFDSLSRAMHRSDNMAEGLDAERQALLDQLRAAEQVGFQLERTREGLQRQLAHAEGSVGVLQARLGDAQSDAEALRQRVGLEQARVGELEGLLAMARAEQFNTDAILAASGAERQMASLREQKGLLEEQVSTLQRQLDGVVQRRESQEQELAQLRMQLAAQYDTGSVDRNASQENAVLLQQLAELQKQCQAFVVEAEALRGQVAKLEGARDAAEGGLAAAQQELEQLKHMLREAPGNDAIPTHIQAHFFEMEGLNSSLQQQLDALRQGTSNSAQAADGIQARLQEVQEENDRLLDLLARMDSARAALQRENTQLVGEVVTLRSMAGPNEAGGEGARADKEAPGKEAAGAEQKQIWELQQRLQKESNKRQQAEASFNDLLSSLDALQSPSLPSPATVDQLEKDNNTVKESLQRTQHAMEGVRAQFGQVQGGGAATSLARPAQGK
ncbi:hypothetical protein N2152v2_005369 [Parachlorella kessleri]